MIGYWLFVDWLLVIGYCALRLAYRRDGQTARSVAVRDIWNRPIQESGYNSQMSRTARVVTWNGKDVPPELHDLPAGRYVVEAVDDQAPSLSSDEEAGIEAALESYRQGRIIDARRAREILDAALTR